MSPASRERSMRHRLAVCFMLADATLATEVPTAFAQERERIPIRLSVFVPRSPVPPDYMQMTSDERYAGCSGFPGNCSGRCEGGEFWRTLVLCHWQEDSRCPANPP